MADYYPNPDEILNSDLFELLGLKNLPDEEKLALYEKMWQIVQNRVFAIIADKLTDTETDQWLKLVQEKKNAEADQFLRSKGLDTAKIIVREMLVHKAEIIDLFYGRGK